MGYGVYSLADLFGGEAGFTGVAGEPFAEKVVQGCMLGLGSAAGAFYELFVSA
jgi:hypothetical protein